MELLIIVCCYLFILLILFCYNLIYKEEGLCMCMRFSLVGVGSLLYHRF